MSEEGFIRFECGECHKSVKAPLGWAGKSARCKACGADNFVPMPTEKSGPQSLAGSIPAPPEAEGGRKGLPETLCHGKGAPHLWVGVALVVGFALGLCAAQLIRLNPDTNRETRQTASGERAGRAAADQAAGSSEERGEQVSYLGRHVSKEWVDEKYTLYRDKAVMQDGQLLPVSKVVRYKITGQVLQVLPDDSLLLWNEITIGPMVTRSQFEREKAERKAKYERYKAQGIPWPIAPDLCYVTDLPPHQLTDGRRVVLSTPCIRSGRYRYQATSGAGKTVPAYRALRPLTRTEFAAILSTGHALPKLTEADYEQAIQVPEPDQ